MTPEELTEFRKAYEFYRQNSTAPDYMAALWAIASSIPADMNLVQTFAAGFMAALEFAAKHREIARALHEADMRSIANECGDPLEMVEAEGQRFAELLISLLDLEFSKRVEASHA